MEVASRSTAYGFLSFVDALMHAIYIDREPMLRNQTGSPEEIAERIAVLWHRVLIGASPPRGRLAFSPIVD